MIRNILSGIVLIAVLGCQQEAFQEQNHPGTIPLLKSEDGTSYDLNCLKKNGLEQANQCRLSILDTPKRASHGTGGVGSCGNCYYVNWLGIDPYLWGWNNSGSWGPYWWQLFFSQNYYDNYYSRCFPGYYYPLTAFNDFGSYSSYYRSSCYY